MGRCPRLRADVFCTWSLRPRLRLRRADRTPIWVEVTAHVHPGTITLATASASSDKEVGSCVASRLRGAVPEEGWNREGSGIVTFVFALSP